MMDRFNSFTAHEAFTDLLNPVNTITITLILERLPVNTITLPIKQGSRHMSLSPSSRALLGPGYVQQVVSW